jgi:aminoglycoside phosphotransferase (APT) family kinase protein
VASAGSAVAAELESWLSARGITASVEVLGRATGGLSQETWFVETAFEGRRVEGVLRLPTPSSGGAAIRQQRLALEAVGGRVPAPGLLWHDDSEENPFGRPFIVMARVAGAIPVGWHELAEPARTALAEDAIDVLAELHAIDPAPLEGGAAGASELEFYADRLRRLDDLPVVLDTGLRWLRQHKPPPSRRRAIVHGDYRMGNMVVAEGRIAGVLDWEMANVGDPLADLAWCFIAVYEPARVDERALLERYAERRGEALDEDRWRWHRVLGYVRLAYYALSGSRAFAAGRSADLRLAALALLLPVHLDRMAATLAGESPQ